MLSRSPAFAHFVAAAPGAKEIVTTGKLLDLAGRAPDRTRALPYDLVVVDAPSTGHALGMVAAPSAIDEAAHAVPSAHRRAVSTRCSRILRPGCW